MSRAICREFLKLLPRRTLLWATGVWGAFLVLGLVFVMGSSYLSAVEQLHDIGSAAGTPLQVRQHWENRVAGFPVLLSPQFAASHGLALFCTLGTLIVMVLASKLFGDEYTLGTIRRLWTEGPPRGLHLAGKVGAVCLMTLSGMGMSILVAVLLTPVVRWFYPIPWPSETLLPHPGQPAGQLAMQLLAGLAIGLFVAILAGLVASATRSALAGSFAALTLLYLDTFLPAWLQRIFPIWHQRTLLHRAFLDLAALPGLTPFGPPAGLETSPAVTLAVLAAYLLLLASMLLVVWKRQEVQ